MKGKQGISRREAVRRLAMAGAAALLLPAGPLWAESAFDLGLEGQELLARGSYAQAVQVLSRGVKLDPRNEWLWGLLGRSRYHSGDMAGALSGFRTALRLNPDDTYSRMMIDIISQKPVAPAPRAERPKTALEMKAEAEERSAVNNLSGGSGLGYHIRRVVLDAGHGGFDPGAVGKGGLKEKDVTLDLVRRTARIMDRAGFKIFMTRTEDYYVPLSARTATANRYRADLFVSFHINANENRAAKGSETYFCSEKASSKEAARLAKYENSVLKFDDKKAAAKGWVDMEDLLFRFERRRYWEAGGTAAKGFQARFASGLPMRNRGVHSANFFVLRKARMPSVLLETGFISNPDEERLLRDSGQLDGIARAVAAAVSGMAGEGV